nr:MAG TPA: hypothetical protein [Caudoviricetes sp.]
MFHQLFFVILLLYYYNFLYKSKYYSNLHCKMDRL